MFDTYLIVNKIIMRMSPKTIQNYSDYIKIILLKKLITYKILWHDITIQDHNYKYIGYHNLMESGLND